MSRVPEVHTDRLALRAFTMDDVPAVVRYAGSRKVYDTTLVIPNPYTEPHAVDWISGHGATPPSGAAEARFDWAVTLRETDELIGAIGLSVRAVHERAEMGYWIGPPYWNRGFATEAAVAVIRCGFKTFGLNRIYADHFRHNPASGRVLQKAGLRLEGTLRNHYQKDGRHCDSDLCAILRSDVDATTGRAH